MIFEFVDDYLHQLSSFKLEPTPPNKERIEKWIEKWIKEWAKEREEWKKERGTSKTNHLKNPPFNISKIVEIIFGLVQGM